MFSRISLINSSIVVSSAAYVGSHLDLYTIKSPVMWKTDKNVEKYKFHKRDDPKTLWDIEAVLHS